MVGLAAGAEPMRRLILCGLLVLAGCQGVVGPRQRASQPGVIDAPWLTPDEQKARMRDQSALPLDSPIIGPRTYSEAITR
jgi:hypothetical protein